MIQGLARFVEDVNSHENPEQELVRCLGLQTVLVLAPAGCGKTEVLATRAKTLVDNGWAAPPRQLLALTFSNRAKENLQSRLRHVMGVRYWERVVVTNFHGFARRLIIAHGGVEALDPGADLPQRGWLLQAKRDLGIGWDIRDRVERNLRTAKRDGASDDEVMDHLRAVGDREAIRYEEHLRRENRLDYDDLLRHADRILSHEEVARLYQCRFSGVLIDEVQDLTLQQLRFATTIAPLALTAVGDLAQGIYAFAGAEPSAVLEAIERLQPAQIRLRLSYRSAPRVLDAVNAVAALQGVDPLECADPTAWPDPGHVVMVASDDYRDEAARIVPRLQSLANRFPEASLGVIVRIGTRADAMRAALERAGIDFEDWRDMTHNRRVVRLMRRHLSHAMSSSDDPHDQLRALIAECRSDCPPEDPELLDDLLEASAAGAAVLDSGGRLDQWVKSCRSAPATGTPVARGIHLLTAHSGKGQQFDWVVALGLEEDLLPYFLAVRKGTPEALSEELRVLHVMISRAKAGLFITHVRKRFNAGGSWPVKPSRWWAALQPTATETL